MSILFKTLALVLCLTFLFAVMIPQAQAGWGFWKCIAAGASCLAGMAAASALCANPATTAVACWAAYSAASSWCATVAANC